MRCQQTLRFPHLGVDRTITELSKLTGINEHTLRNRLLRGWPIEKATIRRETPYKPCPPSFKGRQQTPETKEKIRLSKEANRRNDPNWDLTGHRFGRLTAASRGMSDKWGNRTWDCICDCGRTRTVSVSNLIHGKTTRCGGCVHGLLINLAGQRFGSWSVLCRSERKGPNTYWKCRCICGTVRDVPAQNLRVGASLRCTKCRAARRREAPRKYRRIDANAL